MSLQVWLPLNGNLNNQGLSSATVTATGATVNTSGKIGKCYSFDGDDYITIVSDNLKALFSSSSNPYSMSCWIYLNSDETDRVIIFGNYSANPFSNWELTADEKQRVCAGGTSNYTTRNCSTAINREAWTHIAFSYDGNNTVFYINGSRINSVSGANTLTAMSSNTFYLGSDSRSGVTRLKGKMNDFRIYDHCLSDKEVKEISKGLVLHYKLSGIGLGKDNIFLNTHFDTRYSQTSGWDTAKNGTLLASNWGGYNSGVTNASTVYHAHLKQMGSTYVYEYIRTANETWLGISQGGLQSKLTAGTTYTFSWDQYCVEGANYVGTGLYYYKTGATSAAFHLGQAYGNTNRVLGQWQHFSYTFTAPSDGDYSKNMSWYIYGHNGGNGIMYMKNPKLEVGSIDTRWAPNTSDVAYTGLKLGENSIEYDVSGYGNNGIKYNISISGDTPRYGLSYSFNGSSSYINAGTGAKITDTISVNLWVKYTTWGNPISCTESGGWNFENNGGYVSFPLYVASVGYKVAKSTKTPANLADGKWHMLTGTFDKTNVKIYIDGVLEGTTATGSTNGVGYHASNSILIGAEAANGVTPAGTYMNGNISDVRIYATPLSDLDVKELFNVSASIDNMGNMYGYEVVEQ